MIETMEVTQYIPEQEQKKINNELADVQLKAVSIDVVDQESMDNANNYLTWIGQRQKGIESFRLAVVGPLKKHIKSIDDFFNGLSEAFDGPKKTLSNKVVDYRQKVREAAEKAEAEEKARIQKQIEKAEAKGKLEKVAELVEKKEAVQVEAPIAKTTNHDVGRVTYRKMAEFEIVNKELIPDEFWTVDDKKIGARVREYAKDLQVGKVYLDMIPGVKIRVTEKETITNGR